MSRRRHLRSRRPGQQLEADVVVTRLLGLLAAIRRTPIPHPDPELADDQLLDRLAIQPPVIGPVRRCRLSG